MIPAAIIDQAVTEGVFISLTQAGTLIARGYSEAVNHWLPIIRENKGAIVASLQVANEDTVCVTNIRAPESHSCPWPSSDPSDHDRETVGKLAKEFHNHVFGQAMEAGCCYPPKGRYCHEGVKLRDTYYSAAEEVGYRWRYKGYGD